MIVSITTSGVEQALLLGRSAGLARHCLKYLSVGALAGWCWNFFGFHSLYLVFYWWCWVKLAWLTEAPLVYCTGAFLR